MRTYTTTCPCAAHGVGFFSAAGAVPAAEEHEQRKGAHEAAPNKDHETRGMCVRDVDGRVLCEGGCCGGVHCGGLLWNGVCVCGGGRGAVGSGAVWSGVKWCGVKWCVRSRVVRSHTRGGHDTMRATRKRKHKAQARNVHEVHEAQGGAAPRCGRRNVEHVEKMTLACWTRSVGMRDLPVVG